MRKAKILILSVAFLTSYNYLYAEEKYKKIEPTDITEDTVLLSIPHYRQKYTLSCEIASLKSALEYKNIIKTEEELIKQINFDNLIFPIVDSVTKEIIYWGNPNKGFVGLITGKMPETGYGVYEKPIQELASLYTKAKIIKNAKIKDLTKEINIGNPLIVWGTLKDGKDISWKTENGELIKAIEGEHARVVIGYKGSKNKPEYIFLMDPIKGNIKMSYDEFKKDWGHLNNKVVVIK